MYKQILLGPVDGGEAILSQSKKSLSKVSNEDSRRNDPSFYHTWGISNGIHSRKTGADQSRPECLVLVYARLTEAGHECLARRGA